LEQYIDSGFKNTQKIILELFKDDLKNIKLEINAAKRAVDRIMAAR